MDFAPGWPPGGAEPSSLAGARRAASVSLSRCHRSTEAPDAIGALPASRSARARVRYSPLPGSWQAPPSRASGPDLDGQSYGPPENGTDRSEVPDLSGGPQSFAASVERDLASGSAVSFTGTRSGDSGASRGVPGQFRCTSAPAARVGRCSSAAGMTGAGIFAAALPRGRSYPGISNPGVAAASSQLPIYPILLPIRPRGGNAPWGAPRKLAGCPPARSMPPVQSPWL